MKLFKICFILLFALLCSALQAQDWQELTVDEIFEKAREKAFDGKREESRSMLEYALQKSPDYHDLRILLARTYAWDGNQEEARKQLQMVLLKAPEHEDALNASIDVEIWDEKYADGLSMADVALATYPNQEDFLYKRAVCLHHLKRNEDAMVALHRLLNLNPSHQKASQLMKTIESDNLKFTSGIGYSVDVFSRTFDPAHYANVQLGRTNSWGSAIFRLNYANRFNTNGVQPEVDIYPVIANGVYAYLNYGYSGTELFPKHRVGAELFSKLPKNLEASAGIRYLFFDSETKVMIYTGSLGWYVKSYWVSIRPYITADRETGTSVSAMLFLRKYFDNRDQFVGLSGGLGFSPDERRFQSGSGFSSDGIYLLRSQRFAINSSRQLPKHLILTASIEFTHQELLFDVGEYIWISSFGLGIKKRF